jgi:hypothetical protein
MMTHPTQIIDVEPQTLTLERSPNVKHITVIPAAGGANTDLVIEPGTTPRDIRRQLNLDENFILTCGRGAEAFGDDEDLYPRVPDGSKLYAATPVEVGNLDDLLRSLSLKTPSSPWPKSTLVASPLPSFFKGGADNLNTRFKFNPPLPFPKPVMVSRISAPPSSVLLVQREPMPYWQERGWTRQGNEFTGYYRSKVGAWKGRAEVSPSGNARLFIHQPPEFLKGHPHWICFHPQRGGWYSIHTTDDAELSAAMLRVEEILNEAFWRTHS